MKPDGTDSSSTADEGIAPPKGIHVTEPDEQTGPEIKDYTSDNGSTWSYVFVHNSKVSAFEDQLIKDGKTYFVHKTVRYFRKKDRRNVQQKEIPTISGLIFFQGSARQIQVYLNSQFPGYHLCKNCSTGRVAIIPDSQMRPFMRLNAAHPERIRFLLHPFRYYARNRILLRIVSGELAGLEGYVIRIDRDRRLVMNVGGISVAISGVHAERFEEVRQTTAQDSDIFYKRNLQERHALIDRYFHPVKTESDVAAQAESIDYLVGHIAEELNSSRMTVYEAWNTYRFVIEEIGYYYVPFLDQFSRQLSPIMQRGGNVLREMEGVIANPSLDTDTKERFQSELQELLTKYCDIFMME